MSSFIRVTSKMDTVNLDSGSPFGTADCQDCGNRPSCTGNCVTGCNGYLTEEENAQDNLCCHWQVRSNDDSKQEDNNIFCCKSDCGHVENMANCGVAIKNWQRHKNLGCANNGGRVACTRSCSKRCKTWGSVKSQGNNFPYSSIFQQPDGLPCEYNQDDSGDFNCHVLFDNDTHLYKPWQTCLYNVSDFENASLADLNKYASDLNDTDRNYDEIMTRWCSQQVSRNCPNDPMTAETPTTCSRLHQTGTSKSQACQDWITNKGSTGNDRNNYVDAVGSLYCSNFPDSDECKCVNRGIDPTYQKLKSGAPYNDGCWYNPCTTQHSNFYYVPSDVNVELNPDMCPQNFCLSFTEQSSYNQQYIRDNEVLLNCDFSETEE